MSANWEMAADYMDFSGSARGYFVSLAFWATPQGDRCSRGYDPEEITIGFLQVPGNDGIIQEQHQV